jgi:hypothetical protein
MRFQVPQFIEIEDKIFGPLTLKQFLYLIGSAGGAFILYRFLGIIGIAIAIPVIGFGLALAFYPINGKPFIYTVEAAFNYFFHNRLYLWHKSTEPPPLNFEDRQNKTGESLLYVPKLSENKLKDMTWNLDTKEGAGPGVSETMKSEKR